MKKIFIIITLVFSIYNAYSQGAAGASRQFKDSTAWSFLQYLKTDASYTIDTPSMYSLVRLMKNFKGHSDWEYATYKIDTCFSIFLPIIGGSNIDAAVRPLYIIQKLVRYQYTFLVSVLFVYVVW